MKIAIIGYSGAGKSTLARQLGEYYSLPVFHFDRVQFLPGWEIREDDEKMRLTKEFMDSNNAWVMDGNYSRFCYERRMEEADVIVMLLFGRFACLWRAFRRYLKYKNTTRPDMGEGCNEKFDREFMWWILREGRKASSRERYKKVLAQYPEKTLVIKNQKQLDAYLIRIKTGDEN